MWVVVSRYSEKNDTLTGQADTAPLVSVVVAFYNIENCVHYCVESLLAQTFGDCEFVLVDDGSSDGTARLLDSYAKDPRVCVIHKNNGGLSDARNRGVKESRGKYITFVDGDDTVSPRYVEVLVQAMQNASCRMVLGKSKIVRYSCAKYGDVNWNCEEPSFSLAGRDEFVEKLLYGQFETSAWSKLAPRWVYEQCPFPEGMYYEEIATVASFASMLGEFVSVDSDLYGYVMRVYSTVHRKVHSALQVDDYVKAHGMLLSHARDHCPTKLDAIPYHEMLQLSRIGALLARADIEADTRHKITTAIGRRTRNLLPIVLGDKNAPLISKIRFGLFTYAPKLYPAMIRLYEKSAKGV